MRGIRRAVKAPAGLPAVHPRGCGEYDRGNGYYFSPDLVHPRGCGEYALAATGVFQVASGSSPRVRGIHITRKPLRADNRFIPAGAGNTLRIY